MKSIRLNSPALLFAAFILLGWELSARGMASPHYPALSKVLIALAANAPEIASQIGHTLARASAALGLVLATMIPLGILMGRIQFLADLFEPVVELLRPLPPPAIVPVVMLFAGIGDPAKITVIFYAASFPVLINTFEGVRGTHPMLAQISRSLRLSRREAMWYVDLPAALPVIMTGVRISVAAALLVSVTAEMLLSTDGIGVYLLRSQENFRMADGLAGILVIAFVGWWINFAFLALDRVLLAWHYAVSGNSR